MGDSQGAGDDMVETLPPTRPPTSTTVPPVTEIPGGLVHPVVGYLVCILVLGTFGAAIAIICYRHYRKRNVEVKLPVDEEAQAITFKNDNMDNLQEEEEPQEEEVKTVHLRRNGKSDNKMNGTAEEVRPILSDTHNTESLSESIETELAKFAKQTEDLPMIDENDEMSRSQDKLAEPLQPPKPQTDKDPKPVSKEPTSNNASDSTAAPNDSKVSEPLPSPPPSPRSDRETLTESQVLEILDDAPEDDSPEQDNREMTPDTELEIGDEEPLVTKRLSDEERDDLPHTPANTPQENEVEDNSPVEITADVHDMLPPPPLPTSPLHSATDHAGPRPQSVFPEPPPPVADFPDTIQDSSTKPEVDSDAPEIVSEQDAATKDTLLTNTNTNNSNLKGNSCEINTSRVSCDTHL